MIKTVLAGLAALVALPLGIGMMLPRQVHVERAIAIEAEPVTVAYVEATSSQDVAAFLALRGLVSAGPPWDEYVSDPGVTPEADLLTNIYQPVR